MNRLLFLLPVLFMACNTQPKTTEGSLQAADGIPVKEKLAGEKTAEPAEVKQAEDKPAAVLAVKPDTQDSGGLENESYEEVFSEVKAFIERLNHIIQSKDYDKWKDALSKERFNEISSPEFLANVSSTDAMKRRNIVVNTVHDYFLNVVVPSRANSQVDKIEILDNSRVRAFYMSSRRVVSGDKMRTETVPLLVYELRKSGNSWAIIQ
jgi:hypothetical protein